MLSEGEREREDNGTKVLRNVKGRVRRNGRDKLYPLKHCEMIKGIKKKKYLQWGEKKMVEDGFEIPGVLNLK